MLHSSAAYGSPQFQPPAAPLSSAELREEGGGGELLRNRVDAAPSLEETPEPPLHEHDPPADLADRTAVVRRGGDESLGRPPNPFVPLEAKTAEKSAAECRQTVVERAMDIIDCVSAQTFLEDGSIARYGTTDCDFNAEVLCRFFTVPDEALRFPARPLRPPLARQPLSFAVLTGRPLGSTPEGDFLLISEPFGNTPDDAAVLQTDIKCQLGNADLSFDYWSTVDDLTVKVCTRVGQDRRCTSDIVYTPDSTRVTVQVVHPEAESFAVEIIVTGFRRPGVFLIDNLEYRADLCELKAEEPMAKDDLIVSSLHAKGTTDGKEAAEEPAFPNHRPSILRSPTRPAKALDCDFSRDLCGYSQPDLQNGVVHGKWQIAKTRIGDIQTPEPKDGTGSNEGFAFVGLDDRAGKTHGRTVYVLRSPDFQLEEDATLEFDLFRRSNAISLQVCLDTPANCTYESPPLRTSTGVEAGRSRSLAQGHEKCERKDDRRERNEGSLQVIFVATQWKRFKWLAIDNIRLTSSQCK
ncbi:hypothetical protein M3Y99_01804800 [Aphelenchoides fujianensis]|nr:hypothetical protein M3Y99_01804800 [Aphelenchoides fujianensis]